MKRNVRQERSSDLRAAPNKATILSVNTKDRSKYVPYQSSEELHSATVINGLQLDLSGMISGQPLEER